MTSVLHRCHLTWPSSYHHQNRCIIHIYTHKLSYTHTHTRNHACTRTHTRTHTHIVSHIYIYIYTHPSLVLNYITEHVVFVSAVVRRTRERCETRSTSSTWTLLRWTSCGCACSTKDTRATVTSVNRRGENFASSSEQTSSVSVSLKPSISTPSKRLLSLNITLNYTW